MGAKVGRACSVKIGTTQVLGLGTWTISGVDTDQFEDTEFGDSYKTYLVGQKESGTVSFSGYYDPADSTGQDVLRTAWESGTAVTSIRFYIDASSYWTPTTKSLASTSCIYITSWDVSADKSGLIMASFSGKISGAMELL